MQCGKDTMNDNTRFEEYEQKTRRIILFIGVIATLLFVFGLLMLSSDDEVYNPEEEAPKFEENQDILPDLEKGDDSLFIDAEENVEADNKKPIKITPEQINMHKFVIGMDKQNQSILTIGTSGSFAGNAASGQENGAAFAEAAG